MSAVARSVDSRTLIFSPLGLDGAMAPDVKERRLAAEMDALCLADDVPDQVRSQFDTLKRVYMNGLYSYESFTVANRETYRVLEAALKVRFLEHYGYRVPVAIDGRIQRMGCRRFEDVRPFLATRRHGGSLVGHPGFDGSFAALLRWARAERYFYGQHNRVREEHTPKARNELQHGELDYVEMPPNVLSTIRWHYECIQRLWGHYTPGGVAYPGLVPRRPWVLGEWPRSGQAIWFPLEQLQDAPECQRPGGVFHIVLATDGERLPDWRPDVERTMSPVTPLWGPGSHVELVAGVRTTSWPTDSVETLDRMFYLQVVDRGVGPVRNEQHLTALRGHGGRERWYVVRADAPGVARHHVMELLGRDLQTPADRHQLQGPCRRCAAESIYSGAKRHTVDGYIKATTSRPPTVGGNLASRL